MKSSESGACRREEAAATIAAELQLCEALQRESAAAGERERGLREVVRASQGFFFFLWVNWRSSIRQFSQIWLLKKPDMKVR